MKIRVCDFCQVRYPDAKIKYKAEKRTGFGDVRYWEKVELCERCLNKIINATTEDKKIESRTESEDKE